MRGRDESSANLKGRMNREVENTGGSGRAFVLVAWLSVVLLPGSLIPVAHGQAKVAVASARGYPATLVTIPVFFNSRSNVVALQADIRFDASGLSSFAATMGTAGGSGVLSSSAPGNGVRRLLMYSPELNKLSNGVMAHLPFLVASNLYSGVLRLSLTNVVVATSAAGPLVSTNSSGAIAISPVFQRVDGGVDFFLNVTPDRTYLIQASSNLLDWLTLSTNVAEGPLIENQEADGFTYPYRFYRALPAGP